jgi:hypothetical protein
VVVSRLGAKPLFLGGWGFWGGGGGAGGTFTLTLMPHRRQQTPLLPIPFPSRYPYVLPPLVEEGLWQIALAQSLATSQAEKRTR